MSTYETRGFVHMQLKRISNALRGFYDAHTSDRHFYFVSLGALGAVLFGYALSPLREIEILFLVLSVVLVIITELQNTAIETALNKLHPERHDEIRKSKDIAASASMIAVLFACAVALWIFSVHML